MRGLVTGMGASKTKERALLKRVAYLQAQADVASRVSDSSEVFYDIMEDDASDNSIGVVDETNTTLVASLPMGGTKLYVGATTGFEAGQEVSLIDSTSKEDVVIASVGVEQEITGYTGGTGDPYKETVDLTTTGIVNSMYSTAGNGGRKLVRLSNGWLVAVVLNGIVDFKAYVSKDNGATWSFLTAPANTGWIDVAIAAQGTKVHVLITWTQGVSLYSFEATNVSTSISSATASVDTGQSAVGDCSIAVASNGDLHAAWASKNSTYPNSFNVRYSKSTDGGATWAAPTSVSQINTSGRDVLALSLAITSEGYPYMLLQFKDASNYSLSIARWTGSAWDISLGIGTPSTYFLGEPSIAVDSQGVIHCVTYGKDATDSAKDNIRYTKSTDRGITWSAYVKLTSGNLYDQQYPTIGVDADNNLHVVWQGKTAESPSYFRMRSIKCTSGTWGSISEDTVAVSSADHTSPSICADITDFENPVYMYMNGTTGRVEVRGKYNLDDALVDYGSTPSKFKTVISAGYSTIGAGGRKLVQLSNGWFVMVLWKNTATNTHFFYVSKDRGATWSQLCYTATSDMTGAGALVADGTSVHFICPSATTGIRYYKINVVTQTNIDNATYSMLDTGQTAVGDCSIAVASNGDLHATWTSKNSTYPNSFNIRYSKSTDGGVTWAAVTQLTTWNNVAHSEKSPCIVIKNDGHPCIISEFINSSGSNESLIASWRYNGTVWTYSAIFYLVNTYVQSSPCATVASDGTIHVVWQGTDATDTSKRNIRYSKSTDGGATWSAALKLTTGNTYDQQRASITCDSSGNVYVYFDGSDASSPSLWQIRRIIYSSGAWGSVTNLTAGTANQQYPQLCDNYKDFTAPLCVWQDNQTSSVRFAGIFRAQKQYDVTTPSTVVASAYSTAGNGGRKLVRLSNGWLVGAFLNGTTSMLVYASKDNGLTWQLVGTYPTGSTMPFALASFGTTVYVVMMGSTKCRFLRFDVASFAFGTTWADATGDIDTGQTAVADCSIVTALNGDLHAVWASKNGSYPNTWNIRYSKSVDGGVTWAAPTQITAGGGASDYYDQPCIVCKQDGNPFIFFRLRDVTNGYVYGKDWTGSAWVNRVVEMQANSLVPQTPCAVVDSQGIMHCVWGYGSGTTTIRYSKSTDNGVTWSAAIDLLSPGSYSAQRPTITCDLDGNLFVAFPWRKSGSYDHIFEIDCKKGVWGKPYPLMAQGANNIDYPSFCENHRTFKRPLMMYQDTAASAVKFSGVWDDGAKVVKNKPTEVIDRTTPVTMVASAYVTTGNGGRKLVRLSNGWLVSATRKDTSTYGVYLYVSKDNGATWSQLCYTTSANATKAFALASIGTIVYLINSLATTLSGMSFDATTVANAELPGVNIDSGQNSMCDLAANVTVAANGDVHAVWASKNSTYANSFNVRYAKSVDAGKTWSTPVSVSTHNATTTQWSNPVVAILPNGGPVIVASLSISSVGSIQCFYWTGSAWSSSNTVCSVASYDHSYSSMVMTPDGVLHVVWEGKDSTDTAVYNIRYSKSTDGGVTWSAAVKLTSGNTYAQTQAVISYDAVNNLYVTWSGKHATSTTYYQIRQIVCTVGTWGAITNLTSAASINQSNPSTLESTAYMTNPPRVWTNNSTSAFFGGKWDVTTAPTVVAANYSLAGAGGRKLVKLTNGWYVALTFNTTTYTYYVYVSKDSGTTWSQAFYIPGYVNNSSTAAMVALGNSVAIISTTTSTGKVWAKVIDVTTQANVDMSVGWATPDTGQTAMGGCSITAHTDGTLHAAWSSKNATYPNSFNIRYSKSTDGGVTWATPTQLTIDNTSGKDLVRPCIIVTLLGRPVLFYSKQQANNYNIASYFWNGTNWSTGVYLSTTDNYQDDAPSAVVTSDGIIHTVWYGSDASEAQWNIRYSKSTDGGATWSTPLKLTTGNTYTQSHPSISADEQDNLHVVFRGRASGSFQNVRRVSCINGVWGSPVDYMPQTQVTADMNDPHLCEKDSAVTGNPVTVWNDSMVTAVRSSGEVLAGGSGGQEPIYTDHPILNLLSATVTAYDDGSIVSRSPVLIDRTTGHTLKFKEHNVGGLFKTYTAEVRMNVEYLSISEIVSWIKYTTMAGFTVQAFLSLHDDLGTETFTEITGVTSVLDGTYSELQIIGSGIAKAHATLKFVLTRTNLTDDPSVTQIIGAVS